MNIFPDLSTESGAKDALLNHRRMEMVRYAEQYGVYGAARRLGASPNTVAKWYRRMKDGEYLRRLLWREPDRWYSSPTNRTPADVEARVVALRKRTAYGPDLLMQNFDIPVSRRTVARILRRNGLARRWDDIEGKPPPTPTQERQRRLRDMQEQARRVAERAARSDGRPPTPEECRRALFSGAYATGG